MTGAYRLACKYVIHTVVSPVWSGSGHHDEISSLLAIAVQ